MAVSPQISGLKSWSNVGEVLFGDDLNGNFSTITARYNSHTHDEYPTKAGAETISGQWRFDGITLHGTGVTNDASAGDLVLAYGKSLRFAASSGEATKRLIQAYSAGIVDVVGVGADSAIALGAPATLLGANTGDVVLGNEKALRWESGGTTIEALKGTTIGAQTALQIANGWRLAIGAPATVTGAAGGDVVLANNRSLRWSNAAGSSALAVLGLDNGDRVRIAADGAATVTIGATSTAAGAAGGDVVLANNKSLRWANGAGSGTISTLKVDSSNNIYLGDAAGGDVVLANNRSLRWANAAGSGTISALKVDNLNNIYLGDGASGIVAIGSPGSITGAAGGDVVLANNKSLRWANAAGNSTYSVLSLGADNSLHINRDRAYVVMLGGPSSTGGAIAGDIVITNDRTIRWLNRAGTSALAGIRIGTDDNIYVGSIGSSVVAIGAPLTLAGAAGGDVVLANNKALRWVNASGSVTVPVLSLDTSNRLGLYLNDNALSLWTAQTTSTASSIAKYLVVLVNGTQYRIPLYNP